MRIVGAPARARWIAVALLASLAACASVRPVESAPQARIARLSIAPDGSFDLAVRIDNRARKPLHGEQLDARLSLAGLDAGRVRIAERFDIPDRASREVLVHLVPPAKSEAALLAATGASVDIDAVSTQPETSAVDDPDWDPAPPSAEEIADASAHPLEVGVSYRLVGTLRTAQRDFAIDVRRSLAPVADTPNEYR